MTSRRPETKKPAAPAPETSGLTCTGNPLGSMRLGSAWAAPIAPTPIPSTTLAVVHRSRKRRPCGGPLAQQSPKGVFPNMKPPSKQEAPSFAATARTRAAKFRDLETVSDAPGMEGRNAPFPAFEGGAGALALEPPEADPSGAPAASAVALAHGAPSCAILRDAWRGLALARLPSAFRSSGPAARHNPSHTYRSRLEVRTRRTCSHSDRSASLGDVRALKMMPPLLLQPPIRMQRLRVGERAWPEAKSAPPPD